MESYANRRVLVTGGAGFIGSHLVEELVRRGATVVIVVDSLSSGQAADLEALRDRVELVEFDLVSQALDAVLTDGKFEVVFHLAANADITGSVENPRNDLERNLLGTFNLLEAVRRSAPGTRVIVASSAAVFGEGRGTPMREEDPTLPRSPYGVSKLACEHYTRLYAELYGLRTAIARMFSVYGPRLRKQVVYDLMVRLRRNPSELFIHGDGSEMRDMNHVSNVVEAMLLIGARGALKGESYNVASGDVVSIRELAEMLCRAMGLSPAFHFSGAVRAGESRSWIPQYARLKDLGYTNRVGLADGLVGTVAWFRNEPADPAAN